LTSGIADCDIINNVFPDLQINMHNIRDRTPSSVMITCQQTTTPAIEEIFVANHADRSNMIERSCLS